MVASTRRKKLFDEVDWVPQKEWAFTMKTSNQAKDKPETPKKFHHQQTPLQRSRGLDQLQTRRA